MPGSIRQQFRSTRSKAPIDTLLNSVLCWGLLSSYHITFEYKLRISEILWKINVDQFVGIHKNNFERMGLKKLCDCWFIGLTVQGHMLTHKMNCRGCTRRQSWLRWGCSTTGWSYFLRNRINFSLWFDFSLTVHHSINLFLSPTWCTFALFCNICIILDASTCFEQSYAHLQELQIVFYNIWYVTLCQRPCSALVESGLQLYIQSILNQCTARPLTESDIPDAVKNNLDLLKMSILLLETCRGI
jgi:hypothetical protein